MSVYDREATRCPECDFELSYVFAGRVTACVLGDGETLPLGADAVGDVVACSRCGWWRPATASDHPVLFQT